MWQRVPHAQCTTHSLVFLDKQELIFLTHWSRKMGMQRSIRYGCTIYSSGAYSVNACMGLYITVKNVV